MKVEDNGSWKIYRAFSAIFVLSKKFSFESSEPLAFDNSVSDVLASNDSVFETVDPEER